MKASRQFRRQDSKPKLRVRLLKINAGEGLAGRLSALGLTPGVELTVIQDAGGPLLLSVRDSRLAVGRGLAQKIVVELISGKAA